MKKLKLPNGTYQFMLLAVPMSQNVAKSSSSLTRQSCSYSLSAVSLSRQDGVIYRLPNHLQISDKLKKRPQ